MYGPRVATQDSTSRRQRVREPEEAGSLECTAIDWALRLTCCHPGQVLSCLFLHAQWGKAAGLGAFWRLTCTVLVLSWLQSMLSLESQERLTLQPSPHKLSSVIPLPFFMLITSFLEMLFPTWENCSDSSPSMTGESSLKSDGLFKFCFPWLLTVYWCWFHAY